MKILITGGAGFIGKSLYYDLIKEDSELTLLDIKEKPADIDGNTEYIQGDVCNTQIISDIFRNRTFDGIIHLAAVSRVVEAEHNPEECKRTNIRGIENLLGCLQKSSQKPWLIFGSSREVYGEQEKFPVKETAEKKAVNIYGKTKIKGEELFADFAVKNKLSCGIVRFSNVYGNRFDIFDRVIPRFIRAIVKREELTIEGGDQIIDFTHIEDSVKGVIRLIGFLTENKNIIEDFHFCPGIGWSLQELILFIEEAVGKKAKIRVNEKRNYDVVRFIGDNSKVKGMLGLDFFVHLKDGIRLSIKEYCLDH